MHACLVMVPVRNLNRDAEAQQTARAGSPRAPEPSYSAPSSGTNMTLVYAGLCFILLVTIPILGMASVSFWNCVVYIAGVCMISK